MKNFLRIFSAAAILAAMLCLVVFPDRYISVAREGIELWATAVLPSLFPFFFLTLALTTLGVLDNFTRTAAPVTEKLFRCGGVSAYVFMMSALSGYPVGARLIAELKTKGNIEQDEATRMAVLCSTSGPLFVAGTVGVNMYGDKKIGTLMFASHIMSAIICGIIFGRIGNFNKTATLPAARKTTDNLLYECIHSSVISVLCVGGFICIFYLLARILADFKILYPLIALFEKIFSKTGYCETVSNGIAFGLIECTNGCKILSAAVTPLSASLSCALISFGGLSVAFQSAVYLSKANADLKIFFLSKALQMVISFGLCFFLLKVFNVF